MSEVTHRTGWVQSGDVRIFYRAFGPEASGGANAPILILHGSNYFDSYDWIDVARGLCDDRLVVAIDHRGFGQSDWAPDQDYSLDALCGDIIAVSEHLGMDRPIVMGHSMSGRVAIFFAAFFPDRLSRLIVLDTALGKGTPGEYVISVGNSPKVFATVEDAMASLRDRHSPPRFAMDRKRAELALREVEGGYALRRDPDRKNTQSQRPGAPRPRMVGLDSWAALADVTCPVAFIRGALSDRNKPEHYARIERDFPHIRVETVNARHDVAYEAPEEVIAAVKKIVEDPQDAALRA